MSFFKVLGAAALGAAGAAISVATGGVAAPLGIAMIAGAITAGVPVAIAISNGQEPTYQFQVSAPLQDNSSKLATKPNQEEPKSKAVTETKWESETKTNQSSASKLGSNMKVTNSTPNNTSSKPSWDKVSILKILDNTALQYGIPTEDFYRFAYIETGGKFNPNAINNANSKSHAAKGLFQFVPSTAKQYGILGKEFDPRLNSEAAAKFYNDNYKSLTTHGVKNLKPVDLYLAHQQGVGGYLSMRSAIEKGDFSLPSTRANLLSNVGTDLKKFTGITKDEFEKMNDQKMATTFKIYWEKKFDAIPSKK